MPRRAMLTVALAALGAAGCLDNAWERSDFEEPVTADDGTDEEWLPAASVDDEDAQDADGGLGDADGGLSGDAGSEAGETPGDAGPEPDGLEDLDGGWSGDADERETLNRGGDASPPDRQDGYRR